MKNKINVAYIGTLTNQSEYEKAFHGKDMSMTVFKNIKEMSESRFFDVIIVHESLISSLEKKLFHESQIIIVSQSEKNIAEIYPKVKTLPVFTILKLPVIPDTMIHYIDRAYEELLSNKKKTAQNEAVGKSIIVTSFSNGSGKSLLAYNLAAKLSHFFQPEMVALADLNMPFSVVRAMLNMEDNYNWHSIRPVLQDGVPTKQNIQNMLYSTQYGFSLLSGPSDYDTNRTLSQKEFHNLVKGLNNLFKASVIDWHTLFVKEDFESLRSTDIVLGVIEMTSCGVLQAARGIPYVREQYPELFSKMKFVLNRVDVSEGRAPELVQSKLQIEPFAIIDEDRDAVKAYPENGRLFSDKSLLIDSQLYTIAEKLIKELF